MRASSASARKARTVVTLAATGGVTVLFGVLLLAAGEALRYLPPDDGTDLVTGGEAATALGLMVGFLALAARGRTRSRPDRRYAWDGEDDQVESDEDDRAWYRDLTGDDDPGDVPARRTDPLGSVAAADAVTGAPAVSAFRHAGQVRRASEPDVLDPTSVIAPGWSAGVADDRPRSHGLRYAPQDSCAPQDSPVWEFDAPERSVPRHAARSAGYGRYGPPPRAAHGQPAPAAPRHAEPAARHELSDVPTDPGPPADPRDPGTEKEEKLAQLKDLYLTVEAIGDENVGKHFDELLRRQRELIGEYFKESGIRMRGSPGGAAPGRHAL